MRLSKARESGRTTLSGYADEWLPRMQLIKDLKPSTVSNYQFTINRYVHGSSLGSQPVVDIRRQHINAFVTELRARRSAATTRQVLTLLHTILNQAVLDGLIAVNPADRADRPTYDRAPHQAWEPRDVDRFLQHARTHRLGALFELDVYSGLRRGEITALRWSDVDLRAKKLRVAHNRVAVGGTIVENSPKTRSGHRTVPLADPAVAALKAWRLAQQDEACRGGEAYHVSDYVFTNPDGSPLNPAYVTRTFNALRIGAGVPPITFHGLRHQFASHMLSANVDIALVSKLMGHASIGITANIYGHLIGTAGHRAVNAAAAVIAPPRRKAAAVAIAA